MNQFKSLIAKWLGIPERQVVTKEVPMPTDFKLAIGDDVLINFLTGGKPGKVISKSFWSRAVFSGDVTDDCYNEITRLLPIEDFNKLWWDEAHKK